VITAETLLALAHATHVVFGEDRDRMQAWLHEPVPVLRGRTPIRLIANGEAAKVVTFWPTARFRRRRLHNPGRSREARKCRQRLHYRSRTRSPRWAGLSRYRGRTTSACSRCETPKRGASTRPRRSAADGPSASSTGRSAAGSTSARRCRGTRWRWLRRGEPRHPEDTVTAEEEIKDPYVLEFLGLKDEYSETEIEAALIEKLETFLLELGGDFTFVGRQRRLRVGDEWYRIDLLFFHRRLRCLVIIDLKLDKFTHADAGQMHLYLNYAREHWMLAGENPPVGLILCAEKDSALARYALEGLPNKVLAAEYRMALPNERLLAEEIGRTRKALEARRKARPPTSQ
jgi:hypothetical protein